MPPGAHDGHLRFAVQPAGDHETVDPGPILANWAQLQGVLHPKGAKATNPLLGATASDAFLLSKPALERAVLSDPGITIDSLRATRSRIGQGRQARAGGARVPLAQRPRADRQGTVLQPAPVRAERGAVRRLPGGELEISAINGTPIAGHQGPETITDLTIRALLTLPRVRAARNQQPDALPELAEHARVAGVPQPYRTRLQPAGREACAQRGRHRDPGALGAYRSRGAVADRHDQRAELGSVESADGACGSAADADDLQQAERFRDPGPEPEAPVTGTCGTPRAPRRPYSTEPTELAFSPGPSRARRCASGCARSCSPWPGAERASEVAPTLHLGRPELSALSVDARRIEDRTFSGRVGFADLDAVFAQTRRELGKRLLAFRSAEARGAAREAASGCKAAAAALLQGGVKLRFADSRRASGAGAEEAAGSRALTGFARRQRDAFLFQAFADRSEPGGERGSFARGRGLGAVLVLVLALVLAVVAALLEEPPQAASRLPASTRRMTAATIGLRLRLLVS